MRRQLASEAARSLLKALRIYLRAAPLLGRVAALRDPVEVWVKPMKTAHREPRAFDTSSRGMPLSDCAAWAGGAPEWRPSAGPVVVVAPHPDDETLGAGGLLATCVADGIPVKVISVTDGEAACPEVTRLAQVRRVELVGAMRVLGLATADTIRLGFPDGGIARHEVNLAQSLAACLPCGAILMAPFEFDGHPDHEACARACEVAAHATGAVLARYPIWAWHRGSPELFVAPRPVRFMLRPEIRVAKHSAIAYFRSQLDERPGGAIVPPHVLEYFQQPYEVFLL
jgi:LmbE family N-acetylglucosaminyl deacetylase